MTEVPGSHTLSPRGGNHGKPAQNMVTNSLICLSSRSGVCVLSPWEWVGSVTITNNKTWQKQHCFSFQPGSFYFLSLGALNPHTGSPTTWGCHTMGKPKLAAWRGFVEGGKGGERERPSSSGYSGSSHLTHPSWGPRPHRTKMSCVLCALP